MTIWLKTSCAFTQLLEGCVIKTFHSGTRPKTVVVSVTPAHHCHVKKRLKRNRNASFDATKKKRLTVPTGFSEWVYPDLSESILQRADGITGRISREADLLALLKRSGGNPVQVTVTNSTSEAGKREIGSAQLQQKSCWSVKPGGIKQNKCL